MKDIIHNSADLKGKIHRAVTRLQEILPLKQNQVQLDNQLIYFHQELLSSFVVKGRILNRTEMSALVEDIDLALEILSRNKLVVLSDNGDLIGAYPFTNETREHQISVNGWRVNAMCALDALAVSPMFSVPTEVYSRCCVSGNPLSVNFSSMGNVEGATEALCLAIDWGAYHSDLTCADSLCLQISFIIGDINANQWQAGNSEQRELFSLSEAVDFATGFFKPLMLNRDSF